MTPTADPIARLAERAAAAECECDRLRQRNAALAEALRQLLRDTARGIFAASGSEIRAAEAALLAHEEGVRP